MDLALSATGELDIDASGLASNSAFFDITDQAPGLGDGGSTTILLDPEDVLVRRIDNAGTNALVNLSLFWSAADAGSTSVAGPLVLLAMRGSLGYIRHS